MDPAGEESRGQSLRRGFSSENIGDAEAAALYSRGDAVTFAPDAGNCASTALERARLIEWARQNGKLEPTTYLDPLTADTRGAEQLVYISPNQRVHKYFYVDDRLPDHRKMEQGMFGWIDGEEIKTRPASPAEALARIAWFNRLYPQARIEIEGISEDGRIHTSQPYVDGRTASSFNDMAEALGNEKWEPYKVHASDPSTSTFFHPEAAAYLTDVHEHNGKIVIGEDGRKRFQPFDVVPIVPPFESA
jgi:hypothetical protein